MNESTGSLIPDFVKKDYDDFVRKQIENKSTSTPNQRLEDRKPFGRPVNDRKYRP